MSDTAIHQLVATINTYQRLLERYASFILKNSLVAPLIVEEVMYRYNQEVGSIDRFKIRQYLKETIQACCEEWKRTKGETLFLRKPKNPT
jgi:hypothetical protein